MNQEIKDSGERREFSTGAVRDIQEGKGRNDLLHPDVMLLLMDRLVPIEQLICPSVTTPMFECKKYLYAWYRTGDFAQAQDALTRSYLYCCWLVQRHGEAIRDPGVKVTSFTIFVEGTIMLAKHYEKGAKKYGDHNWSKGIPSVSFYDSAHRHIDKVILGLNDEPHVEACMFNIVGLLYNNLYRPDLEFKIYAGGLRKNDPQEPITSP